MRVLIGLLILGCASIPTSAESLFFDDFESGLSAWPISSHGVVVDDPLMPGNSVLSFTGTDAAGDAFSPEFIAHSNYRFVLTFRYLGLVDDQPTPDNLGGYIGYCDGPNIQEDWLGGTDLCDSEDFEMIDDGQWHSYAFEFSPYDLFTEPFTTIRLMVEDWNGGAGHCPPDNLAGDVSNSESTWGSVKRLYR